MASMGKLDFSKTKWDLSPLFKDDRDPAIEKELAVIKEESYKFINKWKERDDYLQYPKILKEALHEYENWAKLYGTSGKQGYYFGLRSALEKTNSFIKAKQNKLHDFEVAITNDVQFFELKISKIPQKDQKKFLESPLLKEYKHYLEKLFRMADHLLSEKEERILNLTDKMSFGNWVRMMSEFLSKEEKFVLDEDGERAKKNFSQILSLTSNKDKKVRKKAAQVLEEIFEKHLDVAEYELNTVCENSKVGDLLRNYSRPDEKRHLADDLDSQIVDNLRCALIKSYNIPREYYQLKAKLLKQDRLDYYERNVEYTLVEAKYSFAESAELVYKTLHHLDNRFAEIFKKFLNGGQLDVFPNKGKESGAFCSSGGTTMPSYILLNHNDKLNDVLTLAHEMGHGIHHELINQHENELNLGVFTLIAEVASTFMEDFVLQRILKDTDDENKLTIMIMKLDSDVSTIFRQMAFYSFELDLHTQTREKGYLTKKEIGSLFRKHMEAYMGEAAFGADNWWIYIPHFRMFFYVYSYAGGLLISKYLQSRVKKDKDYIKTVIKLFSVGGSKSPQDLFGEFGVDISQEAFWEEAVGEVSGYLQEVTQLARKLGKI